MSLRIGKPGEPQRRIHVCTVCEYRGIWTDAWQWFGSLRDEDEGGPIVKVCSEKCRREATARGLAQ